MAAMPRRVLWPFVLVALAAAPAVAHGQAPQPAQPAPPPPPAPAPEPAPPEPASGRIQLVVERAGGRQATVLAGARFRVRGIVKPYVAGQRATLRFYRGDRKLHARRVTIRRGKAAGQFLVAYRPRRAGRLTVRASHRATAALATIRARPRSVDVLPRRVGPGARGGAVRILQRRLAALGYVVGRRGRFDARTARAVLALRKVTGMHRTSSAGTPVMRVLARGAGRFRVRFPRHGRHVEADLSRQVVALIGRGGRVERVYPISSGSPATPTVRGSFRVYRRSPGTNAKGMVHSSYFIGGYAMHGYASVPVYPASHGCLRLPVPDALPIFRWVRFGTPVDVYA